MAEETCPPATQDVALNLENRAAAIETAMYGPLNPAEPNEEYWAELAEEWSTSPDEAKKQRCGNCAVFIVTPEMKDCIATGLGAEADEFDSIDAAGDLGYCEAFDFKCAAARTCRAWVAGGPVTAAGKRHPAAKPGERVSGSKKNKPGSATAKKSRKIKFSKRTEDMLREKVQKHNEKAPEGRRATLGMLKAVYRRGAGAFSSSHRPGMTRDQWAAARVNAFLRLLKSGKPANANYTTDNDLLPAAHPRSTKKSASTLLASAPVDLEEELMVYVLEPFEYETPEQAVLALTEFAGLGYEFEPAIRAAWLRAVRTGDTPFYRALRLAELSADSKDLDLLPKPEETER